MGLMAPSEIRSMPIDSSRVGFLFLTLLGFVGGGMSSNNVGSVCGAVNDPGLGAREIEDLLTLNGEAFVLNAYLTVLGRHPDVEGLGYYVDRLKKGKGKLEILRQLRDSKEGGALGARLKRLDGIILRERISRLPLMSWLKPPHETASYKLRTIESQMAELVSLINSADDRFDKGGVEALESGNAHGVQHAKRDNEIKSQLKKIELYEKGLELSWQQFEKNILINRQNYKGIFVQEITIDWDVPLYQRPQHIATAFGRLGYLVIYKLINWGGGVVEGVRQVAPNVWVTSNWAANEIVGAVHSVYSTSYLLQPEDMASRIKDGVVVYEYIDHIDPQISGEEKYIQRLNKLKDWAFEGGADFIVASAKKLVAEAREAVGDDKVIYVPNGVDVNHYRNFPYDDCVLPEDFITFKRKYKNVVGYFGAIAPWLWYEAISDLVSARPDLGFVFIGPDYFGGVERLPVADNVLYLGPIRYFELPGYAMGFDVCFIPFAPGEIARTTSPLKLFEYFALEKPVVVTSEMIECVAYKQVFSGNSPASLSKAIDQAIRVKLDPIFKSSLARLADENDWGRRAESMGPVFDAFAG